MSDKRYEKIDRLKVTEVIEGGGIQSLRQAVRVAMTAATSASGMFVKSDPNILFGGTSCTFHFSNIAIDWTSSGKQHIASRQVNTDNNGGNIVCNNGSLRAEARNTTSGANTVFGTSTAVLGLSAFASVDITLGIDRASDGSSTWYWYVNGLQFGEPVAVTSLNMSYFWAGSSNWYFGGFGAVNRTAMNFGEAIFYNRLLSAADVLSLCVNGPALADIGYFNSNVFTGDSFNFEGGTAGAWNANGADGTVVANATSPISGTYDLKITTNAANNSGARVATRSVKAGDLVKFTFDVKNASTNNFEIRFRSGGSVNDTVIGPNTTGDSLSLTTDGNKTIEFVASASTTTAPMNIHIFLPTASSGSSLQIDNAQLFVYGGITGQWNAEDAQSDTGQIFDRSGNGNHALLPAAGATVIPSRNSDCKVRGKLTWTASSTAQDVVGVARAIIPVNGVWQPSFMIRSSGSITVNIGDGVDADRYGAAVVLAAGVNIVTPLLRTHDGTNRRLVITPTGSSTATINVLAKYDIVEAL